MGIEVFAAVAGLALSVYGSVKSASEGKKALKAQAQSDQVKQARERRQAVREARIKAALIEQSGENQGAGSSSGVVGGVGSTTSQMNSISGFIDQIGGLNRYAGKKIDSANNWAAIAKVGANVFDAAGGFGTVFDAVPKGTNTFAGGPSQNTGQNYGQINW